MMKNTCHKMGNMPKQYISLIPGRNYVIQYLMHATMVLWKTDFLISMCMQQKFYKNSISISQKETLFIRST